MPKQLFIEICERMIHITEVVAVLLTMKMA